MVCRRERLIENLNFLTWVIYSLIGLAILIFVGSIYYKSTQSLLKNRFAQEDITGIPGGVYLTIVHPSVLSFIPPEEAGRQIVASIAGYSSNTNLEISLDFSESRGVIFQDSAGDAASSIIILDTTTPKNSAGLYIRPAPLRNTISQITVLLVKITANRNGESIFFARKRYDIETQGAANNNINSWFATLLNDAGIPTSFAFALAGIAIDFYRRRAEERAKEADQEQEQRTRELERQTVQRMKEREDVIRSLYPLAQADIVSAMRQTDEYLKIAEHENWDRSLINNLEILQAQFREIDHIKKIFNLAEGALQKGDYPRVEAVLSVLECYVSEDQKKPLTTIRPFLNDEPQKNLENLRNAINAAFLLWKEHKEDVQNIVNHVVNSAYESNSALLIEELIDKVDEQKILRNPRISPKVRDELKQRGADLHYYIYGWEKIPFSFAPSYTPALQSWLEIKKNLLKQNPFDIQSLDHLYQIWSPPDRWMEVVNTKFSCILVSKDFGDLDIVIASLDRILQESNPRLFFIRTSFDYKLNSEEFSRGDILIHISRIIADGWIKLIGQNPGAILYLPERDQLSIYELLLWRAGSASSLQLWLSQKGLSETPAQQIIFKKINRLPEKVFKDGITNEKVLEWMTIKPPDLENTYILVKLIPIQHWKMHNQFIENLLALSSLLSKTKTVLKVFTSPIRKLSDDAPMIKVHWTAESLKKILNDCVNYASRDRQGLKFDDLFGPVANPAAASVIASQANHSLSELLRLGSEIIKNHVARHPDDPFLDESDLENLV